MKEKFNKITATRQGTIGFFVILFLVATGLSWAFFALTSGRIGPVSNANISATRSRINPNLPKTEPCPINGQKYSTEERAIWEGRRPAVLMVENHLDSRPANGLSKADFVYEAIAEGGITRFAAVFYCATSAEDVQVAPIRSSRVHFINWASEYGDRPLYVHVGGANDFGANGESKPAGEIDPRVNALGLLEQIGWRVPGGNDIDAGYDSGFPEGFTRDPERLGHPIAYEHTMKISTDKLFASAEKRGFGYTAKNGKKWTDGFVQYNFVDDAKVSSPNATNIEFDFWSSQPDYSVSWQYDASTNSYKRSNGGKSATDLNYDNIQLTAKNIIVMEVEEEGPVDTELHMIEDNIGSGNVLVFQNGTVIKGKWSKADRTARTKFTDNSGKEISLVRGTTWVEAIPSDNTVTYN